LFVAMDDSINLSRASGRRNGSAAKSSSPLPAKGDSIVATKADSMPPALTAFCQLRANLKSGRSGSGYIVRLAEPAEDARDESRRDRAPSGEA
jgi:hypothetical protein